MIPESYKIVKNNNTISNDKDILSQFESQLYF
jgi:hypothetical protein